MENGKQGKKNIHESIRESCDVGAPSEDNNARQLAVSCVFLSTSGAASQVNKARKGREKQKTRRLRSWGAQIASHSEM